MEKALSSGAVFVSIVCGSAGALAALCIYLTPLIIFLIMTYSAVSPSYRRSLVRARRQDGPIRARR